MLRRELRLAALALLAAICIPAFGHGKASAAERVALAIGNGHYVNSKVLPNRANDAQLIARSLEGIGFAVTVGLDVNHDAMEKLLREFVRNAVSAKVAVLFYAGQGLQVAGHNHLIPVDAKLNTIADLQSETFELDKVLAGFDNDPGRANIIILDASRDNPLARNLAQRGEPPRSGAVGTGLAGTSAVGNGTLIAFATAPGGVALDGEGANSPFSSSLAKHIATPNLEVLQLMARVRAEVFDATGKKQIPWVHSSLSGDVFLAGHEQHGAEREDRK